MRLYVLAQTDADLGSTPS